MKTEREQTIEVLEHIRDLLDSSTVRPNSIATSKAWGLAYAECERLSQLELDALRTAFEEEDESVCLGSDLPGMFRVSSPADSALLVGV